MSTNEFIFLNTLLAIVLIGLAYIYERARVKRLEEERKERERKALLQNFRGI